MYEGVPKGEGGYIQCILFNGFTYNMRGYFASCVRKNTSNDKDLFC